MPDDYLPISCSFYDRLEEAATLKKEVVLEYYDKDELLKRSILIKTFLIEDKVEYMVLSDETRIRLDRIHSLEGVVLDNHC